MKVSKRSVKFLSEVLSEVSWNWDNYKDYTYVGTLDGLYQHTLITTGTRLRPVEATFLGHMLGIKPVKNAGG